MEKLVSSYIEVDGNIKFVYWGYIKTIEHNVEHLRLIYLLTEQNSYPYILCCTILFVVYFVCWII